MGYEGITVLAYLIGINYTKPCVVLGYHSNEGYVKTLAPEASANIYLIKY